MKEQSPQPLEIFLLKEAESKDSVFAIRKEVFVVEQKVPENEEYDEWDKIAQHFLAVFHGEAVGTCRIRKTEEGVKLERFAVLKPFRAKGVGSALIVNALELAQKKYPRKKVYLHAQISVIAFYETFGFEVDGGIFWECDIAHRKMYLKMNKK